MSISNAFGVEAWNFYPTTFTNGVTLVISNQISITITNNYNFGTNMTFNVGANSSVISWPGWSGYGPSRSFLIPLFTNTIPLPASYWSESTEQFVIFQNGVPEFLPSDSQQTRWPVHSWSLTVTNNFMYALIDNGTGRVLDFVNLGAFGSSFNLNGALTNISETPSMWIVPPAFDAPNSPISTGALNQINMGFEQPEGQLFYNSLNGLSGGFPSTVGLFSDPYTASAIFSQSCSWHAGNPMVHYTIEDLTDPEFNQGVSNVSLPYGAFLPISMDNSVCSLGEINPDYNSGAVEGESVNLSDGVFHIGFAGATDLPYAVWSSTNLLDWSQIGTAGQSASGCFQFDDSAATSYSTRFYQVRLP
jgi:hypothetical protein